MTRIFILLSLSLSVSTGRGQSILDLTQQLALDKEKLASLKSTLEDMQKGYAALKDGYTHIRDIAEDNFSLHRLFIDALWLVSPSVSSDPRIQNILDIEYRIVAEYRTAVSRWGHNSVFTSQEIGAISSIWSDILNKSQQAVEELTLVLTDGQLQMSDAQRLQAIERIDTDIRGYYNGLQRLDNSLAVQEARRQKENNDINALKLLYAIPH
ncbi:MAG: TerB family tellurite resistance protein [Bacteroidetes bacterium]|nr:TerB family tellurite resistance protein [Bacteroidota bacterium]